jgi:hypothetical protein
MALAHRLILKKHNRRFLVIATLLLLGLSFQQSRQNPAHAEPVQPAKIMVVGGSISQGHSGDYTYRYRLWQHLTANGTAVDFVGPKQTVYDENDANSLAYLDPNFDRDHDATWGRSVAYEKDTIASEVLGSDPDTLLVFIGTNDLVWFARTGEEVAADLSTFVANACAVKPDLKIVLSKLTPVGGKDADFNARWADYNDRIPAVAASATNCTQPLVVSDPLPGFAVATDTYDNTHPTPSGEYKIAAAFANALWNGYGIGAAYGVLPAAPAWPQAPTNLVGREASTMAYVSWDPVPGAQGYYVYRKNLTTGVAQPRISVTTTSTSNIYLTNGNTYEYKISAYRYAAEGPTASVQVTPLYPAPTTLTAQPLNKGVKLDWNSVGNTWYYVYMRNVTRGEAFKQLTYPATSNTFTGGLMINGETYEFKVGSIYGKISLPIAVIPTAAPASLTATAGTGKVTLSWPAAVGATSYNVYRKNVTLQETTFTKVGSATGTSFVASGLVKGHVYQFQVSSVNSTGEGPSSPAAQATAK